MQQATQTKVQPQQPRGYLPKRKGTPRRQQNHLSSLSQGERIYASENDMISDAPISVEFAKDGPFTPKKGKANNPSSAQSGSKAKARSSTNGTRPRPKHALTSPGPARPGRKTPPFTAASKISSAPAFAGATFHASPAASSLPKPSFLSKGLDSPSLKESGRASREPSPPATDSEAPTPQHLASESAAAESPLDFFFKAHKAEKERARRASSANTSNVGLSGYFSPPQQAASLEPSSLPRTSEPVDAHRVSAHRNLLGIPSTELDGTPGRSMGPAFSTPYQERIRAARSTEKQTPSDDKSAELMQFLGVRPSYPLTRDPSGLENMGKASAQNNIHRRSVSQAASVPTPSSGPTAGMGDRPQDILAMENSLRRVLKLGGLKQVQVAAPTHSLSN